MGSPGFAVPALMKLADGFAVVGVVTQPDRPSGRGRLLQAPPLKEKALQLGYPIIQPERIQQPEVIQQIFNWHPDVIVVAAYGQILRKTLLDLPPFGCVNIHASLLPRWRGAAPIQASILAGDVETGISIMKMDAGVDTGPILCQGVIAISTLDTAGSVSARLALLGGELIMECLPGYLGGQVLPRIQDENQASYAPMLGKDDGRLEFTKTAEFLSRQVRAFNPWPGTFFLTNETLLKVHAAHFEPGLSIPGKHAVVKGKPAISTAEGLLILDEVQPPGRKTMPGGAYLSGARNWLEAM
jgi:methionyl-tRNA formyltransferase